MTHQHTEARNHLP